MTLWDHDNGAKCLRCGRGLVSCLMRFYIVSIMTFSSCISYSFVWGIFFIYILVVSRCLLIDIQCLIFPGVHLLLYQYPYFKYLPTQELRCLHIFSFPGISTEEASIQSLVGPKASPRGTCPKGKCSSSVKFRSPCCDVINTQQH